MCVCVYYYILVIVLYYYVLNIIRYINMYGISPILGCNRNSMNIFGFAFCDVMACCSRLRIS